MFVVGTLGCLFNKMLFTVVSCLPCSCPSPWPCNINLWCTILFRSKFFLNNIWIWTACFSITLRVTCFFLSSCTFFGLIYWCLILLFTVLHVYSYIYCYLLLKIHYILMVIFFSFNSESISCKQVFSIKLTTKITTK